MDMSMPGDYDAWKLDTPYKDECDDETEDNPLCVDCGFDAEDMCWEAIDNGDAPDGCPRAASEGRE